MQIKNMLHVFAYFVTFHTVAAFHVKGERPKVAMQLLVQTTAIPVQLLLPLISSFIAQMFSDSFVHPLRSRSSFFI